MGKNIAVHLRDIDGKDDKQRIPVEDKLPDTSKIHNYDIYEKIVERGENTVLLLYERGIKAGRIG